METAVAYDLRRARDNHARLTELYRRADPDPDPDPEPDLVIVNAHDPVLYERMRGAS